MAVPDKIYLKNHRRLGAQLETNIPRGVFSGATLDLLFVGGENLENLDEATRTRILDFTEDFLDCSCESNPFCGHPERKFMHYLLELRADGFDPEAIVDAMTADYHVYAYPGDILSFLENAVRTLEAAEAIAMVTDQSAAEARIRTARKALIG